MSNMENNKARLNEIKSLFDILCNTNLTTKDYIPEISSEDKEKLLKTLDDAKAEAERLHIIDIMKKVCE